MIWDPESLFEKDQIHAESPAFYAYLAGIGAAVMVQAFVQWAVYGCEGCSAPDFGGCSREEYHNCNHKAFYENFLSMKE